MSLLIFCALATLAFAAPPPCVEGVNNVVTLGDIGTAGTTVHVVNAVIQLYDKDGKPSCEAGKPKVAIPGLVRLVKGKVIVKQGTDIKKSGVAKWTVKKIYPFFNISIKQDVYRLIGDDFAKMLATPGEYNLKMILKTVSAEIETPKLSGSVSELFQGKWQAELRLESEGKTIAHIKAPSGYDSITFE